jgi:phage terminase large subunit-like protein
MTHTAKARQYAADVLAGKIPACKWARLACKRFEDDLAREGDPAWLYRYDEEAAHKACRFAELMPHVKGKWAKRDAHGRRQLMRLEPWQCFILCNIFGWLRKTDGKRRFHKASVYVPRKNGKSFFGAAIGLYMLAADGEEGAEVYSGATSRKQAMEVFKPAWQMVRAMKDFQDHYEATVSGTYKNPTSVHCTGTNSKFEPVIGKPGDGASPHCAIVDEYHEHQTSDLYDTMDTGMGAREQPLLLVISTAGDNLAGPCKEDWDSLAALLEDESGDRDETRFGIIYTLDSKPQTVRVGGIEAIETLERAFACHNVSTTKIEKLSREACAARVTTDGGARTGQIDAISTPTDRPAHATCAVPVTNNGCSTRIQNERRRPSESEPFGQRLIKTGCAQPGQGGGLSQSQSGPSLISDGSQDTESRPTSLTDGSGNRAARVVYAEKQASRSASITAMIRESCGDCSARNATAQSVCSEILREACGERSSIYGAEKFAKLHDDGSVSITFPPDDWTTEAALIKANPNWGVSIIPAKTLQDQANARKDARKQGAFRTKHTNAWIQSMDAYFNSEEWAACKGDFKPDDMLGKSCILAGDFANKSDLTTLVHLFPLAEGKFRVFCRHYTPRGTVAQEENQHYRAWERGGWLTVTEGNVIDYAAIIADAKEACAKFDVKEMPFDPNRAWGVFPQLQSAGVPVVEYRIVVLTMSEPMKFLASLMRSGKIEHNGDPVLTWAISNVVAQEDRKENVFPNKPSAEKKIDPAVALIMALGRSMVQVETSTPGIQSW